MNDLFARYLQAVETRTQVSPVERFLGTFPVDVGDGFITFEMDVNEAYLNPQGTLMGGMTSALADLAMGVAFATTLEEGETFTTIELKVNFMKPVWNGTIRAEGKVMKRGKTIGLSTCDIYDGAGSLIAYGTSTCMALRGEKAQGR
ncbi:PaaI family thioesterase [Paenibacillus sp. GYB003]|uniref:PaaI family thioesterase n=1 Tax=Paenibacillus sp. GYB003 TaxID=2994392 RepID=UPI002F96668B